jgi:hypothetical protein
MRREGKFNECLKRNAADDFRSLSFVRRQPQQPVDRGMQYHVDSAIGVRKAAIYPTIHCLILRRRDHVICNHSLHSS